jgi:hypothetical protein
MATVLFVHGTGVREAGAAETLDRIKAGLTPLLPGGTAFTGVSWGQSTGVNVTSEQIEDILPTAAARATAAAAAADIEAELWAALIDDPLFELRLSEARPADGAGAISVGAPKSEAAKPIDEALRGFELMVGHDDGTRSPAPEVGGLSAEALRRAALWLADDPTASAVLQRAADVSAGPDDPNLVQPVARAVVARALAAARQEARGELDLGPDALLSGAARAEAVDAVATSLAVGVKGLGDWLGDLAKRFAAAKATAWGASRRSQLMGRITPGVGDILLYQRRGQAIASAIRDAIADIRDDVWAVGHSLGGIMLVDLMSRAERPANVKKLITVGSQSPFFLLSDALETLRPPGAGCKPITPWLNIYDRNDFLSFRAEELFSGAPGVEDQEVSSGVPFPESHGAYWRSRAVYEKISEFCGRAP